MTLERKILTSLRFKGDYLCNTFAFSFQEIYSSLLCEKNWECAVTRLKFVFNMREMCHNADNFEMYALLEKSWKNKSCFLRKV